MTMKTDLAVTVMDQGRAFVNKMTDGDAGYATCMESGVTKDGKMPCCDREGV